jgi:3-oxoacyl-[acyl-carrier protein] reductase
MHPIDPDLFRAIDSERAEAAAALAATGRLRDQVALVTGGSRGIGSAIASALASEGAAVAVNYRAGREAAESVVQEIRDRGGRAIALQGDVADYAAAERLVAETVGELGGLHILVNNAGITRDALVFNMEPDEWLEVMRVNFGGTFNCTKAAIRELMAQRAGSIVNVSSVMGERGWTGESNYAASKGAINAFTRCCAVELARFGVRVNAVLPGFAPTELVAGLLQRDGGKGVKRQIPMRSFAQVEEVARTVAFLAGPDAAYVTGSLMTVDGGAAAVLGVGAPL